MSVKLHRCSNVWVKVGGHPCWRVQQALAGAGLDYELVRGPVRRSRRDALEELSGQRLSPVIEFEDGTLYRDESKLMVERIAAGTLLDGQAATAAPAAGANGAGTGWPAQS